MDISFELYKVFYHVAKSLSFSAAATDLYISQSAVSQSIKLLEAKLKCQLFLRHTKQVKLTPAGELLMKQIEQAYHFIKAGERALADLQSLKQGEVRIGATDTICKHYLLPYFQSFIQQYPQIKLQVTNRTSPECLELLKKGSVDVIVINLPEQGVYPNMSVTKLKTIQDVFIAGNNYAHLKNQLIPFKALEQYPLLLLEKHSTTRNFLDNLLQQNGVHVRPEIELDSVDLLIELAKIGLGISFVVQDYLADELSRGELFVLNIEEEIPPRSLGIVTNSNFPLPLAAQKFMELLG